MIQHNISLLFSLQSQVWNGGPTVPQCSSKIIQVSKKCLVVFNDTSSLWTLSQRHFCSLLHMIQFWSPSYDVDQNCLHHIMETMMETLSSFVTMMTIFIKPSSFTSLICLQFEFIHLISHLFDCLSQIFLLYI